MGKMGWVVGLTGLILGCFSAPQEPDWVELESIHTDANDRADVFFAEETRDPGTLDSEVIELDASESTDSDVDGSPSLDTSGGETDSTAGGECEQTPESGACETVGIKRCNPESEGKIDVCFDPGDGCLYWKSEFCPSSVCQDGACQ